MLQVRLWNGRSAWLLTRYDDIRAAFMNDAFSADIARPGFPTATAAAGLAREILPNFVQMDDPRHRRVRSLFHADFLPGPIDLRRADIQAIVQAQVEQLLAAGAPADLVTRYTQPIPLKVLCGIMGLEPAQADTLVQHVLVILRSDATHAQALAANQALIAFIEDWIDRRRREPGDDMMGRLVARLAAGDVERRELLGAVKQLIAAGAESTASTLAMGALLLLLHPDQLSMLRQRDDPALWRGAVDEIVRFASVTHFGRRRVATQDIEIGGQLIRAGEGVILAENFANRDPAMFPDPDRFDAFRPNAGKHLGFGAGTHHCLGVHLARAELTAALATLFRRLPTLRLGTEPARLEFREDLTIYGLERLPVAWD